MVPNPPALPEFSYRTAKLAYASYTARTLKLKAEEYRDMAHFGFDTKRNIALARIFENAAITATRKALG